MTSAFNDLTQRPGELLLLLRGLGPDAGVPPVVTPFMGGVSSIIVRVRLDSQRYGLRVEPNELLQPALSAWHG